MISLMRRRTILAGIVLSVLALGGCTSVTSGKDRGSMPPSSATMGHDVDLSFRPLVMPPVAWSGHGTTADPLHGLGFPVPTVDTAYAELGAAQQRELATRLATFDCSAGGTATSGQPFIACDSKKPTTDTLVYLLGTVILAGADVASATANPPDVSAGSNPAWTIALELTHDGGTAWAKYTGAHNTGGQNPSEPITGCGSAGTPCADYVAVTVDGAVVSSPYLRDTISGQVTQISGNFTEQSAKELATQLSH